MILKTETKRGLAVVIMAAGKGTRMKDPSKAKVMYELLGKPMIHYVVDLAYNLKADKVIAVVGYQRETVIKYICTSYPKIEVAVQAEQLGTGHAVLQTEAALKDFHGDVIVLSGDVPLLTAKSMQQLNIISTRTRQPLSLLRTLMTQQGMDVSTEIMIIQLKKSSSIRTQRMKSAK